jgi:hypothetical protein
MQKKFSSKDPICRSCVKDGALENQMRKVGRKAKCAICQKSKLTVTIEEIAGIIDPYFRKYFSPGDINTYWQGGGEDDGDGYKVDEQDGESLSQSIRAMVDELPFEDALIEALVATEQEYPGEPFDPFYSSETNYEESMRGRMQSSDRWEKIQRRIKFRQRFFDPEITAFFKDVFNDINTFIAFDPKTKARVSTIVTLEIGTPIWRGRKCNDRTTLQAFIDDPEKNLGPPPSRYAQAGRMNPEGISVFYGSRNSDTCVAELRPAIGERVLVGTFETNRELRLLSFPLLDGSFSLFPLSYFQEDFVKRDDRRGFIRQLHSLISKPVIPGNERNYLITQALAEYLAHVHSPKIDGMIFNSVQEKGGENIVLFLRALDDSTERNSQEFDLPISLSKKREPRWASAANVKYEIESELYHISSDGRVHTF